MRLSRYFLPALKEAPADAKEWDGKPGKLALLER